MGLKPFSVAAYLPEQRIRVTLEVLDSEGNAVLKGHSPADSKKGDIVLNGFSGLHAFYESFGISEALGRRLAARVGVADVIFSLLHSLVETDYEWERTVTVSRIPREYFDRTSD